MVSKHKPDKNALEVKPMGGYVPVSIVRIGPVRTR
jgi:hypothetical protein